MKKLTLLSLAFVLAMSTNLFAQSTSTDEVSTTASVSANIQIPLTISKQFDIDFGTIQNTRIGHSDDANNAFLDPTDENSRHLGENNQIGQFNVSGGANQTVFLSFDTEVTLDHYDDDDAYLTVQPRVSGHTTDDSESSSFLEDEGTFNLNGSGNYFLYVGGLLKALSEEAPMGSYSGTFNISVTYD